MGDTSLEGEHPAPSTLTESFKVFIMPQASIHIRAIARTEQSASVTRNLIQSILTEMRCPSALPSIQDIDLPCRMLGSPFIDLAPDSPEHTTHTLKLCEIGRSSEPFHSS